MQPDCAPFHSNDQDRNSRCRLWTHCVIWRPPAFILDSDRPAFCSAITDEPYDIGFMTFVAGQNGAKVDQCLCWMLVRQRIHDTSPKSTSLEAAWDIIIAFVLHEA